MQPGNTRKGQEGGHREHLSLGADAVLNDHVNLLYRRLALSLPVNLVFALLFVQVQRNQGTHGGQLTWLGVMMLVLVGRGVSARLYFRRHALLATLRRRCCSL